MHYSAEHERNRENFQPMCGSLSNRLICINTLFTHKHGEIRTNEWGAKNKTYEQKQQGVKNRQHLIGVININNTVLFHKKVQVY